jgi:hypothetical protein
MIDSIPVNITPDADGLMKLTDAVAATTNSLIVTWNFRREPIVSIGKLESVFQLFKLDK